MIISPLSKKLQLKPGFRILIFSAPDGFQSALEPLPDGALTVRVEDGTLFDVVHLFVTSALELVGSLPMALAVLKSDGLLWISYPKKTSGVETDLTRDVGWEAIKEAGWEPVRQISVDSTWSALRFRPAASDTDEEAIAAQYGGAKAHLRPILDKVVSEAVDFGPDVTLNVRKSYVALVRGRQFGNIVPSTGSRVDLVLKLPGVKAGGLLQPSGNIGSGSMTHKIALASVDEVDDQVIGWLRQAYEAVA